MHIRQTEMDIHMLSVHKSHLNYMTSQEESIDKRDKEIEKRGKRTKLWGWIQHVEAGVMRRIQQTIRSSGWRRGTKLKKHRRQGKKRVSWNEKDQMLIWQVIWKLRIDH